MKWYLVEFRSKGWGELQSRVTVPAPDTLPARTRIVCAPNVYRAWMIVVRNEHDNGRMACHVERIEPLEEAPFLREHRDDCKVNQTVDP